MFGLGTRRAVTKAGVLATGTAGRIALHSHYFTAADVGGFVVERDERGLLSLRAHIANADDYKMTQQPLIFIVTLKAGAWQWPIEEVWSYRDHALTARLGEPIAQRGTEWVVPSFNPR